jgi:hypothetical protein
MGTCLGVSRWEKKVLSCDVVPWPFTLVLQVCVVSSMHVPATTISSMHVPATLRHMSHLKFVILFVCLCTCVFTCFPLSIRGPFVFKVPAAASLPLPTHSTSLHSLLIMSPPKPRSSLRFPQDSSQMHPSPLQHTPLDAALQSHGTDSISRRSSLATVSQ